MNKRRCIGAFENSGDLWMEMIINYKQTWNYLVNVIMVYLMYIQKPTSVQNENALQTHSQTL